METYAEVDAMHVMGYGVDEEGKVVARGKVKKVEGGLLHGLSIEEGCISVQVTESVDPSYMLFRSVDLDDLPVTIIGEAVGNFILWPTEFLRHSSIAE